MKKFVVGCINFFDNDLIMEVIEAIDWKDALNQHSSLKGNEDIIWPDSLKSAKIEAFNMDMMIDVIEIK